jgi:hypothetical protein
MVKTRKRGGGSTLFFETEAISADPNSSSRYKSVGVISFTTIMAINAVRSFGTNFVNGLGMKGFENTIYEKLRIEVMDKLKKEMEAKQIHRVSSFYLEFFDTPTQVIAQCSGTALRRI